MPGELQELKDAIAIYQQDGQDTPENLKIIRSKYDSFPEKSSEETPEVKKSLAIANYYIEKKKFEDAIASGVYKDATDTLRNNEGDTISNIGDVVNVAVLQNSIPKMTEAIESLQSTGATNDPTVRNEVNGFVDGVFRISQEPSTEADNLLIIQQKINLDALTVAKQEYTPDNFDKMVTAFNDCCSNYSPFLYPANSRYLGVVKESSAIIKQTIESNAQQIVQTNQNNKGSEEANKYLEQNKQTGQNLITLNPYMFFDDAIDLNIVDIERIKISIDYLTDTGAMNAPEYKKYVEKSLNDKISELNALSVQTAAVQKQVSDLNDLTTTLTSTGSTAEGGTALESADGVSSGGTENSVQEEISFMDALKALIPPEGSNRQQEIKLQMSFASPYKKENKLAFYQQLKSNYTNSNNEDKAYLKKIFHLVEDGRPLDFQNKAQDNIEEGKFITKMSITGTAADNVFGDGGRLWILEHENNPEIEDDKVSRFGYNSRDALINSIAPSGTWLAAQLFEKEEITNFGDQLYQYYSKSDTGMEEIKNNKFLNIIAATAKKPVSELTQEDFASLNNKSINVIKGYKNFEVTVVQGLGDTNYQASFNIQELKAISQDLQNNNIEYQQIFDNLKQECVDNATKSTPPKNTPTEEEQGNYAKEQIDIHNKRCRPEERIEKDKKVVIHLTKVGEDGVEKEYGQLIIKAGNNVTYNGASMDVTGEEEQMPEPKTGGITAFVYQQNSTESKDSAEVSSAGSEIANGTTNTTIRKSLSKTSEEDLRVTSGVPGSTPGFTGKGTGPGSGKGTVPGSSKVFNG